MGFIQVPWHHSPVAGGAYWIGRRGRNGSAGCRGHGRMGAHRFSLMVGACTVGRLRARFSLQCKSYPSDVGIAPRCLSPIFERAWCERFVGSVGRVSGVQTKYCHLVYHDMEERSRVNGKTRQPKNGIDQDQAEPDSASPSGSEISSYKLGLREIPLCRFFPVVLGLSVFLNAGFILFNAPQVPRAIAMPFALIAMLSAAVLMLTVLVVCPAALVYLLLPGSRGMAVRLLLCAAVHGMALYGFSYAGARVRTAAFESLAARSAPLVDAIRQYETDHGRPPETLEQLVPDYLDAVPSTGLAAYPAYHFDGKPNPEWFMRNSWVIFMHVSRPGNFDRFVYFPNQQYPDEFDGCGLQRMGDWAYYHD